jgi:glycosyltransferase involved in cell wall biosynthesis
MFGVDKNPGGIVDKYFRVPTILQKNIFYNGVDIWLAPASLEGLHLPPAEAMMTGCPVVATDVELSGTQDYLIHGDTGLVSENSIKSFIDCVEILVKDRKSRLLLGKRALFKISQLGSRKENMQKMLDLFKEKNEDL